MAMTARIQVMPGGIIVGHIIPSDHTCDNQHAASSSINGIVYFDENGTEFTVSGY